MSENPTPIAVFCSYAREDERWLRKLETHLSPLKRQNLIATWHDRLLGPGTDWAQDIDAHLNRASIILLLVSADFLASDYCYGIEMQRALERQKAGQARVVPILLRSVDWTTTPFAHLQVLPTGGKPLNTWSDEDRALTDVVSGLRRMLEDFSLLEASTPRTSLPRIWNIPYPRNAFFTGRDEVLTHLRTQLQAGQVTALSQPQAISGLGGIGKTQIAVEYAYRYRQEYEAVLWATASNQEEIISSFSTLANLLKLSEREEPEQKSIQVIQTWLQTHRKWLLILDNADHLDLLPPCLPPVAEGHILLTTRAWDMKRLAQRIEVETLPLEQGAVFLLQRVALLAPGAELSQASKHDLQAAMQIVEEVGGLPLALDQAGAYLEATGISISQYLHVYQQHRQTLLAERRALVHDHPEPVATTWALSFQRVEQQNAAAAELLRLCAYLAPDAIPEDIIMKGAPHLGPMLEPVADDPFLLSQAVEVLRAYSLIQRDPRTQTLSVHRLVQAVLRDSMTREAEKQWKQRVVQAVIASCPNVQDVGQWDACEWWLPHAQVCATWIAQENLSLGDIFLWEQLSTLAHAQGDYVQSRLYAQEGLLLAYQTHNETQAVTLLTRIGVIAQEQGDYTQAETLYQEGLVLARAQKMEEQIIILLKNLGVLAKKRGSYSQAQSYYQEALVLTSLLGHSHLRSLLLTNLGVVATEQGTYQEALAFYQEGLDLAQKAGSREQICLLLSNLGVVADALGNYTQSERYLREGLALARDMGHRERISLLLVNLGVIIERQGDDLHAEELYREGLTLARNIGHHERISILLLNLGDVMMEQGRNAEALAYFQEGLALAQKLGHRNYISDLQLHLGVLATKQGEVERAEKYLQEGLLLAYELGHPQLICKGLAAWGELHLQQQRLQAAEQVFLQMLDLVPEGYRVLEAHAQYGLARIAASQGLLRKAKDLAEQSYATFKALGHRKESIVHAFLISLPLDP